MLEQARGEMFKIAQLVDRSLFAGEFNGQGGRVYYAYGAAVRRALNAYPMEDSTPLDQFTPHTYGSECVSNESSTGSFLQGFEWNWRFTCVEENTGGGIVRTTRGDLTIVGDPLLDPSTGQGLGDSSFLAMFEVSWSYDGPSEFRRELTRRLNEEFGIATVTGSNQYEDDSFFENLRVESNFGGLDYAN